MQLRKIVLALAAVTMLASCAKEVTREEAIKIAKENYDSSNQVYASGHIKEVSEVKYSDNVPPEDRREDVGGVREEDFSDPEQVAYYRINSATLAACPDNAKFKADGAKLEFSYKYYAGSTLVVENVISVDEIGYTTRWIVNIKTTMLVSEGVTYEIEIKNTVTISWTK